MHPILKNIRSQPDQGRAEEHNPELHCGIAGTGGLEEQLRSKQREDRFHKACPPAVDLNRDDTQLYGEGERDLRLKSSACVQLDRTPVTPEDFVPDDMGSRAIRQMEAAKLVRNGQHTRDVERWQHDTYCSHLTQLLVRPLTSLGVMYLADFLNTFVELPPNHTLTMQLVTIINHTSEPTLRRLLKDIGEKDAEGHLKNEWLLQLLSIIEMIFKDEPSERARLTALLTVTNEVALNFSKKASGGNYPTTDRLSKTLTYFRRMIVALLALAESLGCYTNNYCARKPEKRCRTQVEPSDESYMFSLKGALEAPESDEEEEEWIRD
ncbi:52K [Snake adenovirus 1]|uniref:Packaging protein 3 n=1 Tax=Snake adenovirus serotype 1 TaxID=189830 RepID=PKG3_ADES1|nr:52K [Snake adenovirus 1]A9CB88.1 RecName: Full=Packaging protein 3; AltName: Full=L1-52/55 kDa protein; AltName: Full=Packaging protein 52K [Snake adenovirus 1]ABA47238.1 52K [Snake adenovirus 1]